MNPNQNKQQILQGHSRPVKDIAFAAGDCIYTASSDRTVICWNVSTGEKIRSYAHSAAVNIISLTTNSQLMITGENTGGVYIWDAQGGVLLKQVEQDPTLCVRAIHLSDDKGLLLVLLAGRAKGAASFINVYKMSDILSEEEKEKQNSNNYSSNCGNFTYSNSSGILKVPEKSEKEKANKVSIANLLTTTSKIVDVPVFKKFECQTEGTKWVQAKFAFQNKSIIISRDDGCLELVNFSNGKQITQNKFHDDIILDFDYNFGLILTASRDGTACVINFDTLLEIKKLHPQNPTRNLNTCRLAKVDNPDYPGEKFTNVNNLIDVNFQPEVLKLDLDNMFSSEKITTKAVQIKKQLVLAILSGGQDSKDVTTTNQKEGGFEILIYDAIEGDLRGNFLTHFGPVNALAVSGDMLASGAEDATVRIYKIQNYLFPIDKNK